MISRWTRATACQREALSTREFTNSRFEERLTRGADCNRFETGDRRVNARGRGREVPASSRLWLVIRAFPAFGSLGGLSNAHPLLSGSACNPMGCGRTPVATLLELSPARRESYSRVNRPETSNEWLGPLRKPRPACILSRNVPGDRIAECRADGDVIDVVRHQDPSASR